MAWLSIVSSLVSAIPSIVGWFKGDDAEKKAQVVADIALKLTGADNHEDAIEAIKNNKALQAKLIQDSEARFHELQLKAMEDRQNARSMQRDVAVNSKSRVAREFIYWYAAVITALAAIYIGCVTFLPIPENSIRFADTCLGFILGTVVSAIIQFFYGASKPVREDE